MGIIGALYFRARLDAVTVHSRSLRPRQVGLASRPDGNITINLFVLTALARAFKVSLFRSGVLWLLTHSTGISISLRLGAARTASLFAKNVISGRCFERASNTATPSEMPAGWLATMIAQPVLGICSIPVIFILRANVFARCSNAEKADMVEIASMVLTACLYRSIG